MGGETVFYCHDANKNVTDLVGDDGELVAHYEYSPFGVITDQSDTTLSEANPFRFSNEYFDDVIGLIEYKYRKYNPDLGKFLSRDPIEEQGGLNLYAICANDLINHVDLFGLSNNTWDRAEQQQHKCGDVEVGIAAFSVLLDIRRDWLSWGHCKRRGHCRALYHLKTVKTAWDIMPLNMIGLSAKEGNPNERNYWPLYWPGSKGLGAGVRTVQYKGKCYNACDVNYIQWGYVHKLCEDEFPDEYSLARAVRRVKWWKSARYLHRNKTAEEFTRHGYYGLSGDLPSGCSNCQIQNTYFISKLKYRWKSVD